MGWIYLISAGGLEVIWPLGLKYSCNPFMWIGTILVVAVNFYLLIKAYERLPASTAYTVFAGIGTLGIFMVDAFVIKEAFHLLAIIFLMCILIGIIGLKLVTTDD